MEANMIELFENNNTSLEFTFPDVHPEIKLAIWFARQLRIPDCVEKYHLPRNIGEFKLHLIDDFPKRVLESWRKHNDVIMPRSTEKRRACRAPSASALAVERVQSERQNRPLRFERMVRAADVERRQQNY